jgi:hypothetical protein
MESEAVTAPAMLQSRDVHPGNKTGQWVGLSDHPDHTDVHAVHHADELDDRSLCAPPWLQARIGSPLDGEVWALHGLGGHAVHGFMHIHVICQLSPACEIQI